MNGFFESFLPVAKALQRFALELGILSLALLIAIISFVFYLKDYRSSKNPDEVMIKSPSPNRSPQITVDVSGAVEKAGIYEATSGARLKDVLIQAGGLSAAADREFFARNFNLAKFVSDQEKIYIPSYAEVLAGIFTEPQKIIDPTSESQTQKININSATPEELDTLPGIGKVASQKIIQNRPYKNIEELLSRKILRKNVYENIKNLITN